MQILLSALLAVGIASAASAQTAERATAIFAGGCFWCVEADFDKVPGVVSTTSGYIGGNVADPTYRQVSGGSTGHAEAVKIVYDPRQVDYTKLVDHFFRTVDPTVKNRQFCDVGDEYRTAIFVQSDEERRVAEAAKVRARDVLKQPIYTEIVKAGTFYAAEDYHQDFYTKNATKYKFYRWNCGRDQRLEQLWGKKEGS